MESLEDRLVDRTLVFGSPLMQLGFAHKELKVGDLADSRPRRSDRRSLSAINPNDGTIFDVFITNAKMDYISKRGMGATKELAYTVPAALIKPTAIFRGVREEGENNWLCYCARPSPVYDYKTGEARSEPWPGEVFLVFVNEERVVYAWRWDKADENDNRVPRDYSSRFLERAL